MRHLFSRLASLHEAKPTLRERAAALKATVTRVMRRNSIVAEADHGRRSVMVGSLAVAAAIPLPMLATQALAASPVGPALPHPDQALFDADVEVSRTKVALETAAKAAGEAYRAYWDALGPCPAALVVKRWEQIAFGRMSKPWLAHHPRWAWIARFEGDDNKPDPMAKAWTAESLRTAIRNAVFLFGKGGRTPRMIQQWRSLVPVAEAFESRRAEMNARFRHDELAAARKAASGAHHAANVAFANMPAKTLDGLALKTRQLEGCSWHRMPSNWVSLLQSAAAVSGVTLSAPDFDVPGWLKGWKDLGGAVKQDPVSQELMFCVPPQENDSSSAFKSDLARLTKEFGANEAEIHRWAEARL